MPTSPKLRTTQKEQFVVRAIPVDRVKWSRLTTEAKETGLRVWKRVDNVLELGLKAEEEAAKKAAAQK